ncbi:MULTISPECIES: L-threonylcarbamoyladenylate synthase [Brachybacterium]|uniref:Threonylcarbamoyl-AMP synthase n=2 Tax=Brachybacterium TaxID=43668 RepID=A0A3R8S0A3_9MICO|nr:MULTISPECIES: L-threonylcarbamoyladenylate synthase [Brachybacterium]MCT1438034.1 L-threonylcarbamoyladenylate synthase [Brachybacterium paraconglomeratum]RRR19930.1 threonylcarbamoyl-AMP synthase [Brachybacterium paraconglomeratum]GLI31770.1 threonylcarbamoyl-AMP synthase [Brachybacterium conglomeratum]GLK03303.1 threonylcarbamoyl-AMP synthase [Brachybacterium conglomeratum]
MARSRRSAKYLDIHPEDPQPRLIEQAVAALEEGGLIAYPTDSCYALGCRLGDADGLERIRRIRQVGKDHHFTLVCADFAQLGQYVLVSNPTFRLVKNATPGPYTFILPATREVPRKMAHPKKHTVGVRIPDHRVAHALVEALGEPILSSTLLLPWQEDPPSEGWVVQDLLGEQVDVIIDSGEVGIEPTTVVDLTGSEPVIAREGAGNVDRI